MSENDLQLQRPLDPKPTVSSLPEAAQAISPLLTPLIISIVLYYPRELEQYYLIVAFEATNRRAAFYSSFNTHYDTGTPAFSD